jgi:hypothetical protein
MEKLEVIRIQNGQDRPYGDFYYKYEIRTDAENFDLIFEKVREIIKEKYHAYTTTLSYSEYREQEKLSFDNHFKSYYQVGSMPYGYLLKITSPSTH